MKVETFSVNNIAVVGGGSLGHVVSGWLADKGYAVSMLTRKPERWSRALTITQHHGTIESSLHKVSNDPEDIIPDADVVILTVPGYANRRELISMRPYLKDSCYVGGIFCSSGFFFEALDVLPEEIRLWGFQRVPFIARIIEYGSRASILGTRNELNIAVERTSVQEKEVFRNWVEKAFKTPTILRNNYLEVSITNSNPILHTARLYTMFHDWTDDTRSDHNILFYEEWTEEAAELMIKMDVELFKILKHLPVDRDYLAPLLEYYESSDSKTLQKKLSSISGFKGITSPMKEDDRGWMPDYSNRYFTEDFGYSLRYIWELGKKHKIITPSIDMVYTWGIGKINHLHKLNTHKK